MFALRGLAVSLTFFVLWYFFISALVLLSWRHLRWLRTTERSLANLLFLLRVLPLFASVGITFVFVVPSFQLLEPRSNNEGMGTIPIALGSVALFFIVWGCYRVIVAQRRTSRIVASWIEGSRPLNNDGGTIALRLGRQGPPLTLVGMSRPQVLVSDSTVELLTEDELHIALKHEFAHIRSYDNLKKLLFRFSPFPGIGELEAAWSHAAELAADDAAVTNMNDAVDLAAALVKLSRLVPVDVPPVCTVGFLTGSLRARVARLLAWHDSQDMQRQSFPTWAALPGVVLGVFFVGVNYGTLLAITHEATEWLVR